MGQIQTFSLEGAAPNAAWFQAMVKETFVDVCTQAQSWPSFAGKGGIHRAGVLVDVVKSADTTPLVAVIDSEIDWRDRLVLVLYRFVSRSSSEEGVVPGGGFDATDGQYLTVFGYTRYGQDDGESQAGQQSDHIQLHTGVHLFADDGTGAGRIGELKIEVTNAPTWAHATIWMLVIACEKTGQNETNTRTVPVPGSGTDGVTPIDPRAMNALQDATMLSQMRQGEMTVAAELSDPTTGTYPGIPSESISWPLGPVCSGNPKVPLIARVKPRGGMLYPGQTLQRRQQVAGQIRSFFSRTCAVSSDQLVDDRYDYRDRMVVFIGASDSSDIRPGVGASEDVINGAAGQLPSVGYFGPGGTGHPVYVSDSKETYLYADAATGVLRIAATGSEGATQYVVGMIYATFKLGPHS